MAVNLLYVAAFEYDDYKLIIIQLSDLPRAGNNIFFVYPDGQSAHTFPDFQQELYLKGGVFSVSTLIPFCRLVVYKNGGRNHDQHRPLGQLGDLYAWTLIDTRATK